MDVRLDNRKDEGIELKTYSYGIQTETDGGHEFTSTYQCISSIDDQLILGEECKLAPQVGKRWGRMAIFVSWISVVMNILMASAAFAFAFIGNSPASFGFAFNSFLDACTSVIVLWRFWGSAGAKYLWQRERKATILVAWLFVISAFGIIARAIVALRQDTKPSDTVAIIIFASISLTMAGMMAWMKYTIGLRMHSTVLKTDALNSLMGMFMGLGVVISTVVYHEDEKVWYLDSIVGIIIAILLFVTGLRMLTKLLSRRGKLSPPVR
ncbi:transmembrane protein 163a-like [Corticium candelabrum]|uniref:transmembrane protein 163a-like n=1 Tax=Corticium candelabrum TaxID=121492 RepID=UPI002E265AAB|nr:transmembrane protein 163a-like [Corticium candelabrum]